MAASTSFSSLFGEAWRIYWSNRKLWVLGLLSALFGSSGVNVNINYEVRRPLTIEPRQMSQPMIALLFGERWQDWMILVAGFALVALAWVIASFVLGAWVQGSLIRMVQGILQGEHLELRDAFRDAWQRILALVGVGLIGFLPALIVLGLTVAAVAPILSTLLFRPLNEIGQLPEQALLSAFTPILCLVPLLLCIGLPLLIVVGILYVGAQRACVIETLGAWASYRRAARLLRANLGHTVLAALLLFLIGLVVGAIASMPAMFLWIPIARAMFQEAWTPSLLVNGVFLVIYLLFVNIGLGGWIAGFASTLWTRLYLNFLARERAASWLTPPPNSGVAAPTLYQGGAE